MSTRNILKLAAGTAIALLAAGCDSFAFGPPDLVDEWTPPHEPALVKSDIQTVSTVHYKDGIDVDIIASDNQMKSFDVIATEPVYDYFALGSYGIDTSKVTSATDTFVSVTKAYCDRLVQTIGSQNYTLRIKATFTGSADGTVIGSNLVYKGQFGDVADTFAIGDGTATVTLKAGDRLTTNLELADLRAHAIQHEFVKYLPASVKGDMISIFAVKLNKEFGQPYRSATVHVELVRKDAAAKAS